MENVGRSFFHKLVDNAKIGGKILRMRWWLWDFAREPQDLLLADQPCIFTKGIDDPDLVIAQTMVIAQTIGPRKAFMATSDGVAAVMRRQRTEDVRMRMNESSLSQARVRVYARDASARRFIHDRLLRRRSADQRGVPA